MYRLLREGRLPPEVRALKISHTLVTFGKVYIDVTPPMEMFDFSPQQPAYNRPQIATVEINEYDDQWTLGPLYLGWHDYPATLVVVDM